MSLDLSLALGTNTPRNHVVLSKPSTRGSNVSSGLTPYDHHGVLVELGMLAEFAATVVRIPTIDLSPPNRFIKIVIVTNDLYCPARLLQKPRWPGQIPPRPATCRFSWNNLGEHRAWTMNYGLAV